MPEAMARPSRLYARPAGARDLRGNKVQYKGRASFVKRAFLASRAWI